MKTPLITDIQHYSTDDGPGIRTIVFFKGCPLSCVWCHNPESIKQEIDFSFNQDKCIQCNECASICPENAISFSNPGWIDKLKCSFCNKCSDICPSTALKSLGKYYSIPELTSILLDDIHFYKTSGGGVTFSGGEPTLNIDYLSDILIGMKHHQINTAIQTSGMFNLDQFIEKIVPYTDIIYFDIKLMDNDKHTELTGQSNIRILENFKKLISLKNVKIIPVIPIIPDITGTRENLMKIADFLRDNKCKHYRLLPYHPGGIEKRFMIGEIIPLSLPYSALGMTKLKQYQSIIDTYLV